MIADNGMVRAAKNRQNDEGTRRGIVTEVLNRLNHVDVGVISELWTRPPITWVSTGS